MCAHHVDARGVTCGRSSLPKGSEDMSSGHVPHLILTVTVLASCLLRLTYHELLSRLPPHFISSKDGSDGNGSTGYYGNATPPQIREHIHNLVSHRNPSTSCSCLHMQPASDGFNSGATSQPSLTTTERYPLGLGTALGCELGSNAGRSGALVKQASIFTSYLACSGVATQTISPNILTLPALF
jgi:hypothetical protein